MDTRSSWLNPKCRVRSSRIHGKGVFAIEGIQEGERVAVFGGQVMAINEIDSLPPPLDEYPMQIEERFVLGSRSSAEAEDSDYFNHSCDPNCGFKGQIFLVAMREIDAGEELTFDYAMILSVSSGSDVSFRMNCRCKTRKCRKVIDEQGWQRDVLQKRYAGYFSQYLQDKMAVKDFTLLHEGDRERTLNKKIDTLIAATEDYIVYLDEDLFVEWSAENADLAGPFGKTSNAVAYLESLSTALLARRHVKPFRRMLGEALARVLEHDTRGAKAMIDAAEKYLKARSTERARVWYLSSAGCISAASFALSWILTACHRSMDPLLALLATVVPFGGLGALVWIVNRTLRIELDAAAGPLIHFVEGAARVLVGLAGASVIVFAMKADIVGGFLRTNGELSVPLMIVLGFAAGVSERLVPALIQHVDATAQFREPESESESEPKMKG